MTTYYRTPEVSVANAYGGRDDVPVRQEVYADEETELPKEYAVHYWGGRLPERKGQVIGYADTRESAWALVHDNREMARSIGWLWIHERETDRAFFDLQEPRRGLANHAPRSEFGNAD